MYNQIHNCKKKKKKLSWDHLLYFMFQIMVFQNPKVFFERAFFFLVLDYNFDIRFSGLESVGREGAGE